MITITLSVRDWALVLRFLRWCRDMTPCERTCDELAAVVASIERQERANAVT
jgi:hypothetical protein